MTIIILKNNLNIYQMKKKLLGVFASLTIGFASYISNENYKSLLTLDNVDAFTKQVVMEHEGFRFYRIDNGKTDIHNGFEERSFYDDRIVYETVGPVFHFLPDGSCEVEQAYTIKHIYHDMTQCCWSSTANQSCNFAWDPSACSALPGYVHPSHE